MNFKRTNTTKKRSKSFLIALSLLLFVFLYMQYGRDVTLCSSTTSAYNNGYSAQLVIVANKIAILDTDKFSQELMERYFANDFKEIKFRYDVNGYPNKLHMTVYTNKSDWQKHKETFLISCTLKNSNKGDYALEIMDK